MKPRVAVIDDLEPARQVMARVLGHEFTVPVYDSVTAALAAFEADPPDVIITDLRMPGIDGLTGLRLFRDKGIDAPVIVMTAYASVETAVEAMKAGAFEYLRKPIDPEALELLVRRAAEHVGLRKENARLRRELQGARSPQGIVGKSPPMLQMLEVIERVAPTDVPVLIEGESGTGKDLVARAIHAQSRRAAKPYVALNMAAVPESLAESELFGHEKGAFSGAAVARHGFFAEAEGGTFFLDEIGALSSALQPKLLRVLQDGEYIPVGSRQARKADVRIVCATNEDLKAKVASGAFREDLYYRIHVMPVRLPALRQRREDIPLLVDHFVSKHAQRLNRPPLPASPEALRALLDYRWPGNVRELENAIERALLLAKGDSLRVEDLPPEVRVAENGVPEGSYRRERDEWERHYLEQTLREAGGSVAKAAEVAGLHRSTLYEKLARHGLVTDVPGP
ncbi:MAG TPA: sigma-54 dependent transcriptional regulator [Myxococcales bacterium]|nr:sigma-54 dependent transcriptional regulator [Myxococcales bacterium]